MARKSSGFKELLAEKRAMQDKFKMVERIKQQVQSGDYGEQVKDVIIDPEGYEKMSDVMNEFIEPYSATINNISDYKTLLMMGAIAWNASVVPEDKQEAVLKLMTNELLANSPVDIWEDTKKDNQRINCPEKETFCFY